MRIAVYPGSFDPITNGHLDVLERALPLFDQVIVAVLHHPSKKCLFSVAERKALIATSTAQYANVAVDSFEGLLVDYVKMKGATAIIRGLREMSDFENELRMAHMNRRLHEPATTFFIPTNYNYSFISSSLIKEVAGFRGDIDGLVPKHVAEALRGKYRND